MNVCNVTKNINEMENGILISVSDKRFSTDNDSMQSADRIQLAEINNSGNSRTDQVSVTDINAFYPVNEVPPSLGAREVDAIAKTVSKEYNVSEAKTFIVPDSSHASLLCTNVNKLDRGICEDSDSHRDVLNTVSGSTEEVILKPSTPSKLGTVQQILSKSVTCEGKLFSGDNDQFSETTYSDTLSMNTSGDVFPIRKDREVMGNDVTESKRCGAQKIQFITDNLQNEIPVLSIQDVRSESDIVINNDSGTMCADEKFKKDSKLKKATNSKCVDETVMSVKDNQCQQILSKSSVPARKSPNNVSGSVLYQCTYCSFTVKQLEELSSHVLTCAVKRKQEQNQESYRSEAPSLINVPCGEKSFLEGNNQLSETVSTDPLSMNTTGDGLLSKKETKIMGSDGNCKIGYVIESKRCGAQNIQFITDNLQNEIPVLSIKDVCSESDIIVINNNSDIISPDEKDKKDSKLRKAKDSKYVDKTVMSVQDNRCQQHLIKSSVPSRINLHNVSGTVLYQCVYCSFTDKQIEKLSSHVWTCAKRRRQELNQESYLDGEPPSKTRVLENQRIVLPNTELTTESKTRSIVLSHTPVPVTPKNKLIITPQAQLLTSPQVRIATAPKTQLNSLKPTQFVVSSPTQQTGTNKTVFSVSPKLVATTTNQVINPQTQSHISAQPRVSVSSQNLILKPQISVPSQTQSSSMRVQPVITLQTQLPVVSTAQIPSASKPQIVTPSQIPFASATKVTLGPHSQVPIIPQAPLTLPQQGLTIAQAGTQLLITTKPVQQSAGNSNQPTLLGLGIGTNPAVVPNNIVLLPNVLLNSVSPCGKVNGKLAPAVQRQLIFQRTAATTPRSVTPIQLQKSSVNIPQSTKTQSRVFMAPLFTVGSNPVPTSGVKTAVSNTVQKSKLSLSSSTSNCISATTTNTALASITNVRPELSKQMNMSLDKFICEICDDSVKDLGKLRSHMKCLHEINIHPKVMPSFNCQKCQFCFFTEQGLERHLVGSHGLVTTGMQEAADKGKDGGRCPICGWGYQNKLLHHVATDHKVCLKPADLTYKCTLCTATFGVYKRFEDHVYSVHRPAISKLAQGSSESSSPAVK